ncbi:MAG: VanZ family protein [Eubacteriales bacterium]|nr:VanZ family protein [Eubacteriales bacterium]
MRKQTKKVIRIISAVLFVGYVLCMIYFLFFAESYGRVQDSGSVYHYNLHPFLEIRRFWRYRKQLGMFSVLINIFGNVVCFIPYGFMLPILSKEFRNGFLIVLSGFTISFAVEVIQLATRVGTFDVDDLILNTLGTVLGYFAFTICNKIRRNYYGKKI